MDGQKHYILIQVLKVVLLLVLLIVLFGVGLSIGYGVIGDGRPLEVFNKEVWTHITDFFM